MTDDKELFPDEDFFVSAKDTKQFRNNAVESRIEDDMGAEYFRNKLFNALKIPVHLMKYTPPPYLDPAVISLSKNENAKSYDRWQSGPKPSDFGEHEPIPDEAVNISPVVLGGEDKK